MSDLFHRDVPDAFILDIFSVMAKADWHQYQVLTKRPSCLMRLAPQITKIFQEHGHNLEKWPQHIWMGVSVETIQYKWRVEQLRKVPASVRFVSAEPLLGSLKELDLAGIHWLIVGGESGIGHRKIDPEWVEELCKKCNQDEIAFFFKQWGGRTPKARGRLLDERTWDEFPSSAPLLGEGQPTIN